MGVNPKQNRRVLRTIIEIMIVLVLAVGTFFALEHFMAKSNDSEPTVSPEMALEQSVPNDSPEKTPAHAEWIVAPDLPRYISIPSIGMYNARVETLGVKSGTDMQFDDPRDGSNAGWYSSSAKPGSGTGAGLYDGHYIWYSRAGAFYRLGRLAAGDQIIIERGDGELFTYRIVEAMTVPSADVNMAQMMQSPDPEREGVSLITCGGTWDEAAGTYSHRTTVRAVAQ